MRNYEMKKTGNRIKTVRCLLTFMWFRQIIFAGNVRRQILKLLSGAPAADEVNDQASGNGLLPGVLLPVKENPFPLLLFQIRICRETPPGSGYFPKEFFGEGINAEVKENLEKAIETYKELGAEVEEVSLDIAEYALASYYIIACAEASSNLGRFDGVRYGHRAKEYSNVKELITNSRTEGFGPEVKRRIILGTYVLSSGYYDAYYKKAQQVRTLVMNEFKKVFDNYDVILTPTSPTVAFDIGSKINDPLAMYLADICTVSVNIAGLPGISIPCGVDKEGMPVGMQLIGNRFAEETLLNAAYTFEQKVKFSEKYKPEFKK